MALLKKMLAQFGIEEERVRLDWVSASEGVRFASIVNQVTEAVRAWGRFRRDTGRRLRTRWRSMGKLKVALYWASSCGGCDIATLAIGEKILDVAAAADIVFWPVAMDFKYKDVEAMAGSEHRCVPFQWGHSKHRGRARGKDASRSIEDHDSLRLLCL